MKLLALLKAKALVTIVAGFLLVGGATAAFAATPTGQTVVQSIAHTDQQLPSLRRPAISIALLPNRGRGSLPAPVCLTHKIWRPAIISALRA